MQFNLSINYSIYVYTFLVEKVSADRNFEVFKLSANDRVVLLQSNRPMLRSRGLKKKPITWKVMEGEIKDQKAFEKVCMAIEQHLADPVPPKPIPPKLPPPTFAKRRRDYYGK